MENPDTLILNLTFLGTVGVAFLMFLVLFLLGVITLVLAGLGRLAAVVLLALFGRGTGHESLPLVRLTGPAGSRQGQGTASDGGAAAASPPRPPRAGLLVRAFRHRPGKAPRDWRTALKPAHVKSSLRTAVEHHPALAAARREPPVLAEDWAAAVADADARAKARARAATPQIKLSVRDLPDPAVPAENVAEVAPLVESALDNSRPSRELPRSFKKPQVPHPLAPLDTGSLASLSGPAHISKAAEAGSGAGTSGPAPKGKQPLP
ncbi:hypothetical protein FHJ30_19365 [Arthrobacter sp. BB-1]|uniref:hypothetical protein n=1 Tax=unclassified Arthrobacter TaxID=235627 RepID=UPI001112A7D6|nr:MULTISPECIES: hypothetical protein [unclassified Arthrobacter]TNB68269.1 hypothetical protein FHJ30_19365 [Arthrobacter sp. BB-1]